MCRAQVALDPKQPVNKSWLVTIMQSSRAAFNYVYSYQPVEQSSQEVLPVTFDAGVDKSTFAVAAMDISPDRSSADLVMSLNSPDWTGHGMLEYELDIWSPSGFLEPQEAWTFALDTTEVLRLVGNFVVSKIELTTHNVLLKAAARATFIEALKPFRARLSVVCTPKAVHTFYAVLKCNALLVTGTQQLAERALTLLDELPFSRRGSSVFDDFELV